jgi:hypothetical protein
MACSRAVALVGRGCFHARPWSATAAMTGFWNSRRAADRRTQRFPCFEFPIAMIGGSGVVLGVLGSVLSNKGGPSRAPSRLATGRATVDSAPVGYAIQSNPRSVCKHTLLVSQRKPPRTPPPPCRRVCPVVSAALDGMPCSCPLWAVWLFQAITSQKLLVASDLAPIHSSCPSQSFCACCGVPDGAPISSPGDSRSQHVGDTLRIIPDHGEHAVPIRQLYLVRPCLRQSISHSVLQVMQLSPG